MRKFFTSGPWAEKHISAWLTLVTIMIHVGLASAIISGGTQRFSPPSYNPLINYTHGQTWVWGLWIAASAIFMATPFRLANILGLWLGMVWHTLWMACFAIATFRYETSAATPIPMYGGMAMICAALLTARVIDKTRE